MRPTKHQIYIQTAELIASRGTCARRQVGCVLVNKLGHVVATGYNGVPTGFDHCVNKPCLGAGSSSGKDLDKCEAIHAEQNALLQCPDTQDIHIAYCTDSPCIHCVKLLLNTSCERIIYLRQYPHREAEELWKKSGRYWQDIACLPKYEA